MKSSLFGNDDTKGPPFALPINDNRPSSEGNVDARSLPSNARVPVAIDIT
jgi:hypothetical protein